MLNLQYKNVHVYDIMHLMYVQNMYYTHIPFIYLKTETPTSFGVVLVLPPPPLSPFHPSPQLRPISPSTYIIGKPQYLGCNVLHSGHFVCDCRGSGHLRP